MSAIIPTEADGYNTVKFDGETLPPILNALETQVGNNKLVLEVAVRRICLQSTKHGFLTTWM